MINLRNAYLWLLVLPLVISGCGGGGGSDTAPAAGGPTTIVPPTSTQILADAKNYSATQLKTAATSLANEKYTGLKQTAAVDIGVAQDVIKWLFDTDGTNTPFFHNLPFAELRNAAGVVDTSLQCSDGGSVSVVGQLSPDLQGNLTLSLNNCTEYYDTENINGIAAMTINVLTDNEADVVIYYDNLSYSVYGVDSSVSGYLGYSYAFNPVNDNYTSSQDIHAVINIGGDSIFMQSKAISSIIGSTQNFELTGDIYLPDTGKLSFTSQGLPFPPPYVDQGSFTLNGDKVVTFEFGSPYPYIRYLEDSDNDGNMDVGTFFADATELLYSDAGVKTLVAINNMSLPPVVYAPNYYPFEETYTTTSITVEKGYVEDLDNASEELLVSFIWYLNGNVIADQNSDTLPARIAVFGDALSVAMLVSDGVNVIQGPALQIQLADSPLQVNISNVPNNVRSGDLINFTAQISDPDVPASIGNPAGAMIGAPEGATINENGEVTWQVPSSLLLPTQTFSFTFKPAGDVASNTSNNADSVVIDIDVQSSKEMPLARKGIESPKNNHSVAIGDFNGDGLNEILSTDTLSSIFLLAHEQDTYTQMWAYPFQAGAGPVVQVLSANLDNDDELEIIVVSENSISIIYDLHSMAVEFLATDDYITFAQIADTNQDGVLDIAYLAASSEYFSDDTALTVVSLDSPTNILFKTSVDNAVEIAFGNVDNDSNLELVTNNGLVYDASTWQNQWASSSAFGDSTITVGDFNNDGVDEIAGADRWGIFAVYSVVDRAQLATLDNFNSCSLTSADVDSDSAIEIILGDCQWGNITAYNLTGNQLQALWSTSSQNHGAVSLVSGDSDNDGELEIHWGSGISSSGADVFTGVDLNTSAGTMTPKVLSTNAVQLDSYHSAGWSNISDNDENAVFFVPSTQSGSNGSRLVYMKPDGNISLSSELSSKWDASTKAVTTDFNKDGFGDIFLPLTDLYNGAFGVMQLSNEFIHWQTIEDNSSDIGVIRAHDINNDGYDDALFIEGNNLKIIDVFNQTIIANLAVSDFISDFTVFKVGNETNIALAHNDKTTLYTYNGSLLSQQSFIEQQCLQLLTINYDLDAEAELLCLTDENYIFSNYNQSLIVYEIQNNTLVEAQRNILNVRVSSLVVDPSTSSKQGLFLAANLLSNYNSSFGGHNDFIASATSSGNVIWRSPLMIGIGKQDSLKARMTSAQNLEILFSTYQMMYWIK